MQHQLWIQNQSVFSVNVMCHTFQRGFCSIFSDLGNMASDIKRALETTQSELKESKEANSVLEKECIVYKSQLEVHIIHVIMCGWVSTCAVDVSL